MRRILVLLMVVPVVLMFSAQPAGAQGPPVPWQANFVSDACGFDVRVEPSGAYVDHEWTDPQGVWHLVETAPMNSHIVLTGILSEVTLMFPNNGMITWTDAPDGSWSFSLRGPQVWLASPLNDDELGIWYTTGRVDHFGEATGPIHYGGVTGEMVDLCPLLAP